METREAILNFQYSEKMKSGLIIGAGLLDRLASLKDEEFAGGRKILASYLEGWLREVRIAKNVLTSPLYIDLERKLMELIGRIQMSQFEETQKSFSEAISLSTTLCQASVRFLTEKGLF